MTRVNVSCGTTPTPGWIDFDNSLSVWLENLPILEMLFLKDHRNITVRFTRTAREQKIRWADVTKEIPLGNGAVAVLYSSHMTEHLDREEIKVFLGEGRRVLMPGGIQDCSSGHK
jgi:hypothetical protein